MLSTHVNTIQERSPVTDFRKVTDAFSVAPQLDLGDMAKAADAGFVLVISNRPDNEAPGQPTSREMEDAARSAGLEFASVPVVGGPTRDQAEAMHQIIGKANGPVLAFCRSGTRSIFTWAAGQAIAGERTPEELVKLGEGAGYDLRPMFG